MNMSIEKTPAFSEETFTFLFELAANNEREWFHANKHRYEELVREPALAFIEAMASELEVISPHFTASPKKVGGSLMRVYRDTRFSRDKTPYKTNIGIQFRHELGRDVHAPGYYLHISLDECFLGAGIWHPASAELGRIRKAINDQPKAWKMACDDVHFNEAFQLSGDRLKRAPAGYVMDHPLLEDLKRKDHIAICNLDADNILSKDFPMFAGERFAAASPYMRFLCKALNLSF